MFILLCNISELKPICVSCYIDAVTFYKYVSLKLIYFVDFVNCAVKIVIKQ